MLLQIRFVQFSCHVIILPYVLVSEWSVTKWLESKSHLPSPLWVRIPPWTLDPIILSCEEAIQLAYRTSVILRYPVVSEVMHEGARGLPPPVKVALTVSLRHKTQPNMFGKYMQRRYWNFYSAGHQYDGKVTCDMKKHFEDDGYIIVR